MKRFSADEMKKVHSVLLDGMTTKQAAEEFGVTQQRICQAVRAYKRDRQPYLDKANEIFSPELANICSQILGIKIKNKARKLP